MIQYILSSFVCLSIYVVYKIRTSSRYYALKCLTSLTPEDINCFYDSYGKIFSDSTMISTLDDFKNNRPPSKFVVSEVIKPAKYTADCYSVLNHLCALGNVKKMYIPPCIDNKVGIIENQILCEKQISQSLNVKPNGTLLELGCGCGRIAHHISKLTNCKVIGINIDNQQLDDAIRYSKKNMYDYTSFLFCDFNDILPFEDNTFDAIYTVQGFITFISDYDQTFNELYRVLKPGGRFIIADAVLLDNFDRENLNHLNLMNNSRPLMAGGVFLHYKYIEDIAKKENFEIISSKGGELPNEAVELPLLVKEHQHFDNIEMVIKYLTKIYVIPDYMNNLIMRLRYGAADLIEMEEKNLITMTWEFILEKSHTIS